MGMILGRKSLVLTSVSALVLAGLVTFAQADVTAADAGDDAGPVSEPVTGGPDPEPIDDGGMVTITIEPVQIDEPQVVVDPVDFGDGTTDDGGSIVDDGDVDAGDDPVAEEPTGEELVAEDPSDEDPVAEDPSEGGDDTVYDDLPADVQTMSAEMMQNTAVQRDTTIGGARRPSATAHTGNQQGGVETANFCDVAGKGWKWLCGSYQHR